MTDFHFITAPFEDLDATHNITFKIRHTPEYLKGTLTRNADGDWLLKANNKIHGVAPGQFCVVYDENHHRCWGSGEIV